MGFLLSFGFALQASALDFRSVGVAQAILYDAPSAQGKKLFIVSQAYPLEVIVNLGDWVKVRDVTGALSWIEAKQMMNTHTLLVVQSQAEMHKESDAASPLIAKFDKDVVLEFIEPPKNGWVKAKHRDGLIGYVSVSAVWGF